MDFRAVDEDKGMTVTELHVILEILIERGYGDSIVFERRFDEPMRYVELSKNTKRVAIMEAW